MALYMLNISVDSADPNPNHIPEDLTFNDQESIIEIVLEKILGYEDAIKEYDDTDMEDHTGKTPVKIDLIANNNFNININLFSAYSKKGKFTDCKIYLTNGFKKLDDPPPKI